MSSRIRKPQSEAPVEMTPEEIQAALEEAEEYGIDVEHELIGLGRTPAEVVADMREEQERWSFPTPDPAAIAAIERERSPITRDSTREEVLAAVAEHEARAQATTRLIESLEFPGYDPDNPKPGCYWSSDGSARMHVGTPGRLATDVHLQRQQAAGEEDQDDGTWGIG